MCAEKLSSVHFLKCLFMSKASLHGTSKLFCTHCVFFFFSRNFVQASTCVSWALLLLWVTSCLLNANVFLPLQKGSVENTAKGTQCISFCTYLVFIEVSASLMLERARLHCDFLPVTWELVLTQ